MIRRVEFAKRDDFIFWRSDILLPPEICHSYETNTDLSFKLKTTQTIIVSEFQQVNIFLFNIYA